MVYSLTVASSSAQEIRQSTAKAVLDHMCQHTPELNTLVAQAQMVSQELIRVAILWQEIWAEALEEASRLYFGEHNVEAMLACLAPHHEMMSRGPQTARERTFESSFGRELQQAFDWCRKYQQSKREQDLSMVLRGCSALRLLTVCCCQAWDLYYHVFRRASKQLQVSSAAACCYCLLLRACCCVPSAAACM